MERTPKKNLSDEDGVLVPPQTPIRWALSSSSLTVSIILCLAGKDRGLMFASAVLWGGFKHCLDTHLSICTFVHFCDDCLFPFKLPAI